MAEPERPVEVESPAGRREELYRRIVESANLGIWVFNTDGVTTFANAKMAEILGYSAEEMSTLSLFDVLDDQGKAEAAKNLELRRQGLSAQLECAFLRKDGSQVWVLLNSSPHYDDAGRYLGVVAMMSEITERKRIEEALYRREQQLAEAQRVAHIGSWEWDVAADHVSWSDELYRIFGLTARDDFNPTFEGFLARVHPDDVALITATVGAALQGGDDIEVDHRIVRPGGEVVWVHSAGEVVRDESGAPRQLRGIVLDISASKRSEEALRHTTSRHRLLEQMASAANEASTLVEVLQAAVEEICAYTGWPVGHVYLPAEHDADVLVSSGIWHLDEPERFQALRQVTAETSFRAGQGLVGGRRIEAPVWVSDVTGDPTHVRACAAPGLGVRAHVAFPVPLGCETAAVVEFFSPEVSECDQGLLDTFSQVATQLSRVAERQRANAELALARDAAMEASRFKSAFLATMSHEIRTPMNSVIGLTALLRRTSLDERQRQYAEGVESAGEALLAVINDILDFSKIEAGKLELEVVDFDPVQVVEETAELVAEAARAKGLELVAYCSPEVPTPLRGDPVRLRQVLLNLASNAIKFTDHGEVVIRARLVSQSDDTVVVRFDVTDTGIGIAPAARRRLFEPFSQADSSTTRRFGGTGLGLAISSQLVAAMGGELSVDGNVDGGSTFGFTLPLGRPAEGTAIPSCRFNHLLEGRRVLVVDDNDTNRMILGEQLSAWDMHPDMAEHGFAALEHLREAARRGQPYDLALLDLCMDGMDGVELARHITADPDLATTRLVLLSSSTDVTVDEVTGAGIAAHLSKPVRLSHLYDCLMRLTAPPRWQERAQQREGPFPPGPPTRRGRVLVVEDSAPNQVVALGILDYLGYRADVAANGREALEALGRSDYAAVLMDCHMPEMDGYSATVEIRRREGSSRHTPIIAMTAAVVEGDRQRCLAAGMDDYIAKPVRPEAIDAVLARWVDETQSDEGGADGVVDPERLDMVRRLGSSGDKLLAVMVETFLAEAPATIAAVDEAVSRGDGPGLRHSAHRLRGGAATLGATRVAERCAELEELGRAGRLETAAELLGGLHQEFDRAARALRATVTPRTADG